MFPSSARNRDVYQHLTYDDDWDLQLPACTRGWPRESLALVICLEVRRINKGIYYKDSSLAPSVNYIANPFVLNT